MKILLSAPVLNDGDAIGNDLLGMANVLQNAGYEVQLFAEKSRVEAHVEPLANLEQSFREPDTLLIHHHSIQCDAAFRAIEMCPTRAIVKYHNVTPSRYFVDANPELIRQTEIGEQQAARMAKLGATFWVDSHFNAQALAREVPSLVYEVLPPFHQAEQLRVLPPDAESLSGLDDWTTTILCVGRVAPNKNLELAIETLAKVREYEPTARLLIAGEHLFPLYSDTLRSLAKNLGVEDAMIVTGRVSASQLKALYRTADVLLVTSHHEGFCVPLVEAMALQVPIVAVPTTAIPETAGPAAIYGEDAHALAECIGRMVERPGEREKVLVQASNWYRSRFSPEVQSERFWELCAPSMGKYADGRKKSSWETCREVPSSNKIELRRC